MESLTKNRQDEDTIRNMVGKYFAPDCLKECRELTEGYFNAAYEITLLSGKKAVLKVAPPRDVPVMSYEKNIMSCEVEVMKLARQAGLPAAEIYGYDNSETVCSSPYFFMEMLEGESLYAVKDKLSLEELTAIQVETGRLNRRINSIKGPYFGFPGQPEIQGEDWFTVFHRMFELGIMDAGKRNIDLKISKDAMLGLLCRDQEIFKEVVVPGLVHWDLWEGNVLVKDGKITGLIDWERSVFGDPLMEVGFRTYKKDISFQKGYGLEALTGSSRKRAVWYDVYLAMLIALEYEYRNYETKDSYDWAVGILEKQFGKLMEGL